MPTRIYVVIVNYVVIVPLAPQNYFLLAPTQVFLGNEIPGDSLLGIPLCFPPLLFNMLLFRGELHISPLGFYYVSPILGDYINHQKDKIAYVPLDPVADYV